MTAARCTLAGDTTLAKDPANFGSVDTQLRYLSFAKDYVTT